jgi:hypothetical protein
VGHAFAVTLVLMGIWSIMGVEFFGEVLPQQFGTFLKAMLTMWTIMTLEGWVDLSNQLIYDHNMPASSLFFISYIFIVAIVMSNVVVAILLDKYLETIQLHRKEAEQKERKKLAFTVALNRFIGAPLGKGKSKAKLGTGAAKERRRTSAPAMIEGQAEPMSTFFGPPQQAPKGNSPQPKKSAVSKSASEEYGRKKAHQRSAHHDLGAGTAASTTKSCQADRRGASQLMRVHAEEQRASSSSGIVSFGT